MIEVRLLLFTAEDRGAADRASASEIRQLLAHRHATAENPRTRTGAGGPARSLLIGRTDGERILTVVIEATLDPTTWLPVTAWESTDAERRILEKSS